MRWSVLVLLLVAAGCKTVSGGIPGIVSQGEEEKIKELDTGLVIENPEQFELKAYLNIDTLNFRPEKVIFFVDYVGASERVQYGIGYEKYNNSRGYDVAFLFPEGREQKLRERDLLVTGVTFWIKKQGNIITVEALADKEDEATMRIVFRPIEVDVELSQYQPVVRCVVYNGKVERSKFSGQ